MTQLRIKEDEDDIHIDVTEAVAVRDDDSEGNDNEPIAYGSAHDRMWNSIPLGSSIPGGRNAANIFNPAPGLTVFAHQRLRENTIMDSFHIFFT